MAERWLRLHPADNVAVALVPLRAGELLGGVRLTGDVAPGHKAALEPIPCGAPVIKYGSPIGRASRDIDPGQWVHSHNLRTALEGERDYVYRPAPPEPQRVGPERSFMGYLRPDGRVGIRNELWILPTVGCVNHTARRIAQEASRRFAGMVDGVHAFTHPYGCSQLGADQENTQRTLAALAAHPNAGGVLLLGLGCENNSLAAMAPFLPTGRPDRLVTLNCQEAEDEEAEALALLEVLAHRAARDRRQPLGLDRLVIGMKCGGSDGFSGITANPLLGSLTEWIVGRGGASLLTEVPEMFGAEEDLFARAQSPEVFAAAADMVNGYKQYFARHGQPVYENPSPGNRAGGITTLEEKSLGCTQKGGRAPVSDVLPVGAPLRRGGLVLVDGPGNDLCAVTHLACAGAQLILFTTGRGTPLCGPVPTLKVATNSPLAQKKAAWIDFDAGRLLEGLSPEAAREELMELVLATAGGQLSCGERQGYGEIAVFKDGVTL